MKTLNTKTVEWSKENIPRHKNRITQENSNGNKTVRWKNRNEYPVQEILKVIEEKFRTLKKEVLIKIKAAYRIPNKLELERNSPCHVMIKCKCTEQIKVIKSGKYKRPVHK